MNWCFLFVLFCFYDTSSCISFNHNSAFSPPGPFVISECSSDRSVVRRMGTQVLFAANGLLHMCTNSSDEDQSMVRPTYYNSRIILFYGWKLKSWYIVNFFYKSTILIYFCLFQFQRITGLLFFLRWYFAVISMSGVFAVTFSVIFAYVADITQEHERSTAYGLVRKRLKPIVTVCHFS